MTLKQKQLLLALGFVAAGALGYVYHDHQVISEAKATTPIATNAAPVNRITASLPDFSSIVNAQGPAVVNISVSGHIKTGFNGAQGNPHIGPNQMAPNLDPNDPFYEFFKHFQGQMPQQDESQSVNALGSGFIVNANGTILTNAHVVSEADEVTVKLTDKREFKAKVLGIDKLTDVAVLKIDAKNLPTVNIGNPKNIQVGEWVLAIGSPFGFENSVTAGIVSAKSRSLPDEGYVPFLQTDVAINPGNSGGPLFNMNGEVIGINSQIYSRSGGYQGLSFAIPIDVAMNIEKQLVENGKVSRGRLGVGIQEVNQDLATSFGLEKPTGALVSSVEKGSPADKAGIQAGDVILQFNDQKIERSEQLPPLVANITPGNDASLNVWRNGKTQSITVKVGNLESDRAVAEAAPDNQGKLGLALRPLTPEEKSQAEVSNGLVVEEVTAGPAAKAGIQAGDVILSVNGKQVSSVQDLKAQLGNNKQIALLIMRGDNKLFVPIKIG